MGRDVPTLETARLRMRGQALADFDASFAMWSDPIVTRYISGRPSTRVEAWMAFMRQVGHWQLLGFGYWLVEDRVTNEFLGEVGYANFKRVIEPSIDGIPELGWVLAPHAHGNGYATEAVLAAQAWGDAHFAGAPTVCLIAPENTASINVARKAGFIELAQTTYLDRPTIVYRRG